MTLLGGLPEAGRAGPKPAGSTLASAVHNALTCYRGIHLDCGYRADLIVDERVLVEVKAIERLLPIHEAQLITYLRLGGLRTGLLINFNTRLLKEGIVRRVL